MDPFGRPVKKPPAEQPLEGIDLRDFDEEKNVAGLKLDENPEAPRAARPPAPPAPPVPAASDLPIPSRPPAYPVVARPEAPVEAAPPPFKATPLPAPEFSPPPAPAPVPTPSTPPPPPPAFAAPPYPVAPAPYPYVVYPPAGPGYAPYGAPGFPPPQVYYSPPPPRPQPSQSAEGLVRLSAAAALGVAYFAALAGQHAFDASTGLTGAPGVRAQATLGVQFFSYFLFAGEAVLASLALAAGASAFYKLRDGRGEFTFPPPNIPPRAAQALALSVAIPLAVGIAGWLYLSSVQRSMPGSGTATDLGLARLFEHYRYAAFAAACAQLASAFLIAFGFREMLKHLAFLAPRKPFREFAALFVFAAALNAALVLVLYVAVLNPPASGAPPSPDALLALFMAAPAAASLALLRLRTYLGAASTEAERRHKEKKAEKAAVP